MGAIYIGFLNRCAINGNSVRLLRIISIVCS